METIIEEDPGKQSHEYMRRKLCCDVLIKAIDIRTDKPTAMANTAVNNFDVMFGKGEGDES